MIVYYRIKPRDLRQLLMTKKNIHIVPQGDHWVVKKAGVATPISRHRTKELADNTGRPLARKDKVELITHDYLCTKKSIAKLAMLFQNFLK